MWALQAEAAAMLLYLCGFHHGWRGKRESSLEVFGMQNNRQTTAKPQHFANNGGNRRQETAAGLQGSCVYDVMCFALRSVAGEVDS